MNKKHLIKKNEKEAGLSLVLKPILQKLHGFCWIMISSPLQSLIYLMLFQIKQTADVFPWKD